MKYTGFIYVCDLVVLINLEVFGKNTQIWWNIANESLLIDSQFINFQPRLIRHETSNALSSKKLIIIQVNDLITAQAINFRPAFIHIRMTSVHEEQMLAPTITFMNPGIIQDQAYAVRF